MYNIYIGNSIVEEFKLLFSFTEKEHNEMTALQCQRYRDNITAIYIKSGTIKDYNVGTRIVTVGDHRLSAMLIWLNDFVLP